MSLQRRKPLTSRSQLRRTPLVRKTPIRRQGARLKTRVQKARRDTGPSIQQRAVVLARSGGRCELCGSWCIDPLRIRTLRSHSIHHRQPRGMGGTRRPEINSPTNLLLVCGDATTPGGCHELIERQRAIAYVNGWLVHSSDDPALTPVLLDDVLYLLTHDGEKVEVTTDAA